MSDENARRQREDRFKFPIPMRGNEQPTSAPPAARQQWVPDPHEG